MKEAQFRYQAFYTIFSQCNIHHQFIFELVPARNFICDYLRTGSSYKFQTTMPIVINFRLTNTTIYWTGTSSFCWMPFTWKTSMQCKNFCVAGWLGWKAINKFVANVLKRAWNESELKREVQMESGRKVANCLTALFNVPNLYVFVFSSNPFPQANIESSSEVNTLWQHAVAVVRGFVSVVVASAQ